MSARAVSVVLACLWASAVPAFAEEAKRPSEEDLEVTVLRLKDDSPAIRTKAARTLGEWGPAARSAVPALGKLLEDAAAEVRAAALFALGRIGKDAGSTADDVAKVLDDRDAAVRTNAARALEMLGAGGRKPRSALLGALKDEDPRVRANAARSLGVLAAGDRAAVSGLALLLRDDAWEVRVNAAWALARSGEEAGTAVARLVRALSDKRPAVRAMAARTIGSIGSDARKLVPPLLQVLGDALDAAAPPGDRAKPSAEGGEDAVLLERLEREGGDRRCMIWALGRLNAQGKDVLATLERARDKDPHPIVRSAAKTALDRMDVTVMPAAEEEKPRQRTGVPNLPWETGVAGGCLEIVFGYEL